MLKKQLKMYIVGVVVAVLIIVVIVVVSFSVSGGAREYDAHLNMAQKYLDELNYEQAIVELRLAIEIEPNNSEAYFAMANVYVAMGDYESALAMLEEGYAATGDTELSAEKERISGEYAELQEQQAEQAQREQEQRVEEFYEKYAGLFIFLRDEVREYAFGNHYYLTFAEREQVYGEIAEQLEQYLADLNEIKGLPEELYDCGYNCEGTMSYFTKRGAYSKLADIYLRMGKLEECLRVRTEWAAFCDMPDLVQDGNHGYDGEYPTWEYWEFDRYGRPTSFYDQPYDYQFTFVYGEDHDGEIHGSLISDETLSETDTTYDSEGRILYDHTVITSENSGVTIVDREYTYTGNNSFVTNTTTIQPNGRIDGPFQSEEQFYDKYGICIY